MFSFHCLTCRISKILYLKKLGFGHNQAHGVGGIWWNRFRQAHLPEDLRAPRGEILKEGARHKIFWGRGQFWVQHDIHHLNLWCCQSAVWRPTLCRKTATSVKTLEPHVDKRREWTGSLCESVQDRAEVPNPRSWTSLWSMVPTHSLLGTRPFSRRWETDKRVKLHLYLQPLTIIPWGQGNKLRAPTDPALGWAVQLLHYVSRCHNNRNKVHSQCRRIESSPNRPLPLAPWKNCLPWIQFLMPKRLGTAELKQRCLVVRGFSSPAGHWQGEGDQDMSGQTGWDIHGAAVQMRMPV